MARQFKQLVEEIGDMAMRGKEETMREHMSLNLKEFADKVAAFNKLGESLYGSSNFSKLAEDLEEIATHAEAYTLRETEEAPFDQITIKRNMKELRGYTTEFKKVASEARSLQERMTALYEDSGRVLGRYFEIKEMGQPDGMSELQPKSEEEKIVNNNPGLREGGPGSGVVGHKSGQSVPKPKYSDTDEPWASKIRQKDAEKERFKKASAGTKFQNESVDEMCEGCGKPMSECTCESVNEADKWIQKAVNPEHKGYCTPMSKSTCTPARKALAKRFKKGIDEVAPPKPMKPKFTSAKPTGNKPEKNKWNQAKWDDIQNTGTAADEKDHLTAYFADKKPKKESVKEGVSPTGGKNAFKSMKLTHIMKEDVNDDRPKDDWMVLDVPKLRYDVAKDFEKDLKRQGFEVKRFDWKERTGGGQEFAEFFVHKKDYDEANKYAVGIYQSYANNSNTDGKKTGVVHN